MAITLKSRVEEPDDSDEVYGSGDPFVRIVESTFRVLDQGFNDIKNC